VRLAHISDLHFGADDPVVVAGLCADLRGQGLSQVLLSGDLTMRARTRQFRRARELLDDVGLPWVSVPGNHDLPLDRPVIRGVRPLHGYQRLIHPETEPRVLRDGVLVLGLNTARPYLWKGGRIDDAQVARIGPAFVSDQPVVLRVLMLHHPVFRSLQRPGERIVRGAGPALRAAAAAGADVVLCGHDHVRAHVDLSLSRPYLGRHLLGIMCGTTTSVRVRAEESQSYNILDVDGDRLTLTVRQWRDDRFAELTPVTWNRTPRGWLPGNNSGR
jgi:3',5'-cyclic AMP phosphodiesterase CpdA